MSSTASYLDLVKFIAEQVHPYLSGFMLAPVAINDKDELLLAKQKSFNTVNDFLIYCKDSFESGNKIYLYQIITEKNIVRFAEIENETQN